MLFTIRSVSSGEERSISQEGSSNRVAGTVFRKITMDHKIEKEKIKKVQWPQWIAAIGGMYSLY